MKVIFYDQSSICIHSFHFKLKLAAVFDNDIVFGLIGWTLLHILDSMNYVHSLDYFSKDYMFTVKMGRSRSCNEELMYIHSREKQEIDEKNACNRKRCLFRRRIIYLWSVRSGATVRHGKKSLNGMFDFEILIIKLTAVNTFSPSSISCSEITTLDHEVFDYTVESTSLVLPKVIDEYHDSGSFLMRGN